MKDALITYISEDVLDEDASLAHDDDLLTTGLLDSIGVMRLIAFIEETFGIQVLPEDVTIERFRSVSTIAEYLATHKESDV